MGSKRKKLKKFKVQHKKGVLDLIDKGVSEQLLYSLTLQSQRLETLKKIGL
jgi:hypothetical protein